MTRGEGGVPTALKLEGVEHVGIDAAGALELVVVAVMDDPDAPAVLASLTWSPR
jgi:hypothetical protein